MRGPVSYLHEVTVFERISPRRPRIPNLREVAYHQCVAEVLKLKTWSKDRITKRSHCFYSRGIAEAAFTTTCGCIDFIAVTWLSYRKTLRLTESRSMTDRDWELGIGFEIPYVLHEIILQRLWDLQGSLTGATEVDLQMSGTTEVAPNRTNGSGTNHEAWTASQNPET
jgi:hypothetical protein